MRMKKMFHAVMAILLLSVPIFAARPLSTDDAGTVYSGSTEMEIGYELGGIADEDDNFHSAGLWVGHGVTDKLDLEVEVPYSVSEPRGLDALAVGAKLLFIEESESVPAFAMTLFIEPGEMEYIVNGIFSKEAGVFSIHLNGGYTATGAAGEYGEYTYALGVDIALIEKLPFAVEITGIADEQLMHHFLSALIGLRYEISETSVIDIGAGTALGQEETEWLTTFGISLGL